MHSLEEKENERPTLETATAGRLWLEALGPPPKKQRRRHAFAAATVSRLSLSLSLSPGLLQLSEPPRTHMLCKFHMFPFGEVDITITFLQHK